MPYTFDNHDDNEYEHRKSVILLPFSAAPYASGRQKISAGVV